MHYTIEYHEYTDTFRVYRDGFMILSFKSYKDALNYIPPRYTGRF